MRLSEISVGLNHKGEYSVMYNDIPMEGMLDFYIQSSNHTLNLARNPYPFSSEKNSYPEKSMAQLSLAKTKDHIETVLEMDIKNRVGSSKWWTR